MSKPTKEEFELLKDVGYSIRAIELYMKKVNVGVMTNPDVRFSHKGPCGDRMILYLKVDDCAVIEDAKFQCFGCPAASSSGSALTIIAKGKTLEEAKKVGVQDVLTELGGLPKAKRHCPQLAVTTLRKAVAELEDHKKQPVDYKMALPPCHQRTGQRPSTDETVN